MNYYVILPDGRKFGPADLATLNQWAREGRLIHASQLEEAGTGRRFPAHELQGLVFPNAGPAGPSAWPQPPQQGPQPGVPGNPGVPQGPFSGPVYPPSGGAGPTPGYYRPPYGPQYGQPYSPYPPRSSSNLAWAWVLGGLGIVGALGCCCYIGPILGIVSSGVGMSLANRAKLEGNPSAQGAWTFDLVVLIVCIAVLVLTLVAQGIVSSGGFSR